MGIVNKQCDHPTWARILKSPQKTNKQINELLYVPSSDKPLLPRSDHALIHTAFSCFEKDEGSSFNLITLFQD
ncbi:hypothetical protein SUGI_0564330 [Cryptomeria japonica]|nr:hypothetical protein SUGI_0564330 [Cryptomeria japonica]